jgi:ABC-2 type transport system permease protein
MRLLKPKVILTFVKKEFRQISRTKEMLGIMLIAPLFQLLILGFAVTNEVKHVKLYIDDRDNSHLSHELYQSFTSTDRFNLLKDAKGKNPEELISDWKAQVILTIPYGFGRDIALGRKPALQITADGIDGNTAAVALNYAQGVIAEFITNELNFTGKLPANSPLLASIPPQVEVQDRMWFNEDLKSAQYMIPGIIVILITVISMMISAMSLVKEKEIGTLEQLMVTPAGKGDILLGKLIPYWLISMFEIVVVTVAAYFIFHIHFAGNAFALGLMAAIYLLTTMGLGILVSTFTGTQQQAMFFTWFMMVFMLLLSGLFIPIENMPLAIKRLTLINPMSYFMTITREIIIKGNQLKYLWKEGLILLGYGILVFTASLIKFRKTSN